jgi:hypothetical protein
MSNLPPFVAKLIASDGYEDKKYFETKGAAEKWILGEGKENFDGDVQRAEIYHIKDGPVWFKDRPKVEEDIRYKQMRNPNSLLWHGGLPRPKAAPEIQAYCDTCQRITMNWREYEEKYGLALKHKPLLRCSECYKVIFDSASPLSAKKSE